MVRKSGVLCPVFSLPGRFGIGTLGAGAREFIDLISVGGFRLWQTLPLHPPDDYGSPYAARSSFALDPALIDPDELVVCDLLRKSEADEAALPSTISIDPGARGQRACLALAAGRCDRSLVDGFLHKNPETAAFCVALDEAGGDFQVAAFLQYEAHREWDALRAYANSRGIFVIGDMPIYPAAGSLDVRRYPDSFLLASDGTPALVAGVPPDYFTPEGQVWGNPLYDWQGAAATGYAYHHARLSYLCRHLDGLRLDHFRGYEGYFAIPAGAGAEKGRWEPGPGDDLFRSLSPLLSGLTIIAEDLGEVGESVDALRRRWGFLSSRVLPFGFLGDPQSPHLPHNCPSDSVVYSGTHDTAPLAEHIAAMPADERRYLLDYCGTHEGEWQMPIIKTLLACHASLAIFPLADLLGVGAGARINTPGRAEGNWRYRYTSEQLATFDVGTYLYCNRLFGRTAEG